MKLGDVYAERGVEYLCGKVSGLTGLEIDYYASLDVGSIASVVDKIGGVSYYIPEDMKYEDPDQDLVIDLKKGTNHAWTAIKPSSCCAMSVIRMARRQGSARLSDSCRR